MKPLQRGTKQCIGHSKAKQKLDTYQQKEKQIARIHTKYLILLRLKPFVSVKWSKRRPGVAT